MNLFEKNYQQGQRFLLEYSQKLGEPTEDINDGSLGKILDSIKWLNQFDQYYALVDLKKCSVTWSHGIEKYLGYPNDINVNHLFFLPSLVHPFISHWYSTFSLGMYDILSKFPEQTEALKTRYMINIPIRKFDGEYVFVRQMSLAFQYDTQGHLVSYLNIFTIVDDYKGQPLNPRIVQDTERKKKYESLLYESLSSTLQLNENFTEQEFIILHALLFLPEEQRKNQTIALIYNWKVRTVDTYITHINAKTKKILLLSKEALEPYQPYNVGNYYSCLPNFEGTYVLAKFLYDCGIFNVLLGCFEKKNGVKIKFEVNK